MNKPILKIKGNEIDNDNGNNTEKMNRSPEETLFYYLINKNINIITDNIYTINRVRPNIGAINPLILRHNLGRKR
jgi:hypothetical protein